MDGSRSDESLGLYRKMNPYTKFLRNALGEIDVFSKTQKGKEWNGDWYKRIKELVTKAADENQERAEEYIDMISWYVVDSGPIGCRFAPSIDKAQGAIIKARRQREINKHKKD